MINNQDLITPSSCLKQHTINFFGGLSLVLILCNLAACTPPTEQERIDAVNQKIAPEGYLTKTHLYINWPAYTTDDSAKAEAEARGRKFQSTSPKEVYMEPLKLKIPVEYLAPGLILSNIMPKYPVEYFEKNPIAPLFLTSDHTIFNVTLHFSPGAKPYTPVLAGGLYTKGYDDPKVEKIKMKYSEEGYSVTINRSSSYFPHVSENGDDRKVLDTENYSIRKNPNIVRVADLNGLERYVPLECYDMEKLSNDPDKQRHYDLLAAKAFDDHSPENCIAGREYQYLYPAAATVEFHNKLRIDCTGYCTADLNLAGRKVNMVIANKNRYSELELENSDRLTKAWQGKEGIAPYTPPRQPNLDALYTDLPQWRDRVEPTLKLLESFVRPQSEAFPSLANPNFNH